MTALPRRAIAMNLSNHAFTELHDFHFNSFASINDDDYLAANEDGLFLLGGANDDDADIDSEFTLKQTDFGDRRAKRFLRAYFGLQSSGDLEFSLTPDGGDETAYLLRYGTDDLQQEHWINLDGAKRGTYWTAKVRSVDGSRFVIDNIVLITAGKAKVLLFKASTGLSTKVDPSRIKYDPQTGVMALASCSNVLIDDSGGIATRPGYTSLMDGSFHSLFRDQGDCLVMQDHTSTSALYRVNPDLTLTGIRSGLTRNQPMAYYALNGQIYYSNGIQNGVYSESTGSSAPWVHGAPQSLRMDKEAYDPPLARHLASMGLYMLAVDSEDPRVLWRSFPGSFDDFDLDDGFTRLARPITMLKAVGDGVWVGTAKQTYFLSGTVPEEWRILRTLPYGAKEGSCFHELISASRLGMEGSQSEGALWLSDRGPCWGGPGGQAMEFGQMDIDWRDFAGSTAACLVTENQALFTITP